MSDNVMPQAQDHHAESVYLELEQHGLALEICFGTDGRLFFDLRDTVQSCIQYLSAPASAAVKLRRLLDEWEKEFEELREVTEDL